MKTFMLCLPNLISWINVKIENEYKMVMKEYIRIGFQKSVFFLILRSLTQALFL